MKMKKRIIALALAAMSVFGSLTANAAFYERTGVPGPPNQNYYNTALNPFYTKNLWSWCTWYCYGRAREILGTDPQLSRGAASGWFSYNKSNNLHPYSTNYNAARIGSVMCFSNRVAMVETVNADGTPGNISGTGTSAYSSGQFHANDWPASKPFYFGPVWGADQFVGYIYLVDNTSSYVPPQQNAAQQNSSGFTVTGYIATQSDPINLRCTPEIKNGNVIGSVPKGATIAIDKSKSSNGWYYIRYGSQTGYVSGKYVSLVD